MKARQLAALVWRASEDLVAHNGIEIAGYIAFTTMLSLFPFLIFLVSVAGFIGDTRTGQDFISTMSLFAPPDVMATLRPALDQITQSRNSGLLTFGLVMALYSAGSGVAALRMALNLSYTVTDKRPFWLRKALDFATVVVGSVIIMLISTAIILGPWVFRIITWFGLFDPQDQSIWHLVRYGFTMVVLTVAVIALHRVLPNCDMSLSQILPGALTSTIAWTVTASLLTLYFGHFANYSSTYGSLGGVIITLLFFYISAIIFIFGGELNAALLARHRKAPAPNPEALPSPARS